MLYLIIILIIIILRLLKKFSIIFRKIKKYYKLYNINAFYFIFDNLIKNFY